MQSLRGLYDELSELGPEDRQRRLDELASHAPEDARRLRAMLEAQAGPPLLAFPVGDVINTLRDDEELLRSLVGQMIGPFRIQQLIAEGGTSAVFRAERTAGLGSQVVALKLLRTGLYSADAQHRFLREQAILAQLSHPDIARLIEAGVSESGIPYIAMEYVDGVPLTHAADARRLDLNARLSLFARLCRAVDAAHASLIVHCDLKPSNVLVDTRGAIKVLDFGIAQLLSTSAHVTSGNAFTPEYAAPEQARQEGRTVATDIFALGVILGELVTGVRVRGREGMPASAIVRNATAELPPGLPARSRLARKLMGDLDAIIGTALAEDPARRYRSADALARDIERFLQGYPVRVLPASRWRRFGKLMRRHRLATVLVASLAVGLLASLTFALVAASRALEHATEAEAAAARADSLRDFMFDAFSDAEPGSARSGPPTIIDAVERALASVLARRDADPRVRIELQTRLAQVLSAQGAMARAGEVFQDAQGFAQAHLQPDDPLRLNVEQLVINNHSRRGNLDAARSEIDALLARIPAQQPAIRAEALTTSAFLAARMHDSDRGLRDAREAVVLARENGEHYRLEQALRALGAVLLISDKPGEAIPVFEDLLSREKAQYGADHSRVAAEEAALSRAFRLSGDLAGAEAHVRAALAIDDRALPGQHPDKGTHLNALMMIQIARRAFDQALASDEEILAIQRATLGEGHLDTLIDYSNIAHVNGLLGRWDEAVKWGQRAALGHVSLGTDSSWQGITSRIRLGHALAMSGKLGEGRAELDRAYELAEGLPEREKGDIRTSVVEIRVRLALDSDDSALAERELQRLAELPNPAADASSATRQALLRTELMLRARRFDDASAQLQTAEENVQNVRPPDLLLTTSIKVLRAMTALGKNPAQARDAVHEARTAFANLAYPPAYLVRYAASLPQAE